MSIATPITFSVSDRYIPEVKVIVQWPLLSKIALRAARKTGKIRWVKGKRGAPWYLREWVEEYIHNELEVPWQDQEQNSSLSLVDSGSQPNRAAQTSTGSGMTLELEELVAQASAQRILKSQSASSPN